MGSFLRIHTWCKLKVPGPHPQCFPVMAKHERLWAHALMATERDTWPRGIRGDYVTCHVHQRALMSCTKCSDSHILLTQKDTGQKPHLARVAASGIPLPVQFLLIFHRAVHVATWNNSGSHTQIHIEQEQELLRLKSFILHRIPALLQ